MIGATLWACFAPIINLVTDTLLVLLVVSSLFFVFAQDESHAPFLVVPTQKQPHINSSVTFKDEDMLFALLTFSNVFFGLCVSLRREEVCYGRDFRFPLRYTPPLYSGPLYFSPHRGGNIKTLMDNGKPQDPRLDIRYDGVFLQNVREDDEGYFSVLSGNKKIKIVNLNVLDCAEEITRKYLDSLEYEVSSQADFLEFTPLHNLKQQSILWNRTTHEMHANGRVKVTNNLLKFRDLTQKDNGYYNFRSKSSHLVSRILLNVQEHTEKLTMEEDESLEIVYPWLARMKTVTFTPEGVHEPTTTMRDGYLVEDFSLSGKMYAVTNGIRLSRFEGSDTGTFHFRDSEDNLIMVVHLKVNDGFIVNTLSQLSIGLLFPALIFVYCCRCYAKRHYKKYHSGPETPAPPAVNHNGNNPAAGPAAPPSSIFSYQPVNVPKAPTVTSSDPPVYQPVQVHVAPSQPEVCRPLNVPTQPQVHQPANIGVTPTQPEVAPSGGWKSTLVPPNNSNLLSSDCEPTFEPKGVKYPSAYPLSSDSTLSDVYTSDKLNFL